MGLNDIRISNPLLVELFRNNLLNSNTVQKNNEPSKTSFLVVTDQQREIGETSQTFLKGILSACQIPEERTQIINAVELKKGSLEKVLVKYNPSVALIFGDLPLPSGLQQTEAHAQQQWKDTSVLLCPPLSELQADRNKKLKLWNFLKKYFGIA